MPEAYICMSAWKRPLVSGLATSAEKKTAEVMARSSTSTPARSSALLTTLCVFCRAALTEVWKTSLSLRPSFSRTLSLPFFHPAASSSAAALSGLNSLRRLGLRKRAGLCMMLGVATPVRP